MNLLELFDPAASSVQGGWQIKNGILTCESAKFGRVDFAYEPPDEYDFVTSFTADKFHDGLALICYGGGRQFMCGIAEINNTVMGFALVNKKPVENNMATKRRNRWLTDGQHYTAVVKVRKTGVETYLDGELVTSLTTNYSNLSLWREWRLSHDSSLGIGAWDSIRFDKVEIVEISGQGKKLSAAAAGNKNGH